MITIEKGFSKSELKVIDAIVICLKVCLKDIEYAGSVVDHNGLIQFQVHLGAEKDNDLLILRIGIQDNNDISDGGCNFIYVPSIYIPYRYSNNFLGTALILMLAKTAYEMGLHFFVTCITNERFFYHLLRLGGVEDPDGDIELYYPVLSARIKDYLLAKAEEGKQEN